MRLIETDSRYRQQASLQMKFA
jgi:hypothetical protein